MTRRPTTSFLENLVIDNDGHGHGHGHGGDDSNETNDYNDDNLVEHDLPSRRMEVDNNVHDS